MGTAGELPIYGRNKKPEALASKKGIALESSGPFREAEIENCTEEALAVKIAAVSKSPSDMYLL